MGVSVAICTTQSPELAPLKKGPKKGLKSKKGLKTKGKSPYSSSKGGKKSGWKKLKAIGLEKILTLVEQDALKKGPKKGLKSKKGLKTIVKTKGKSPKTTPYSSAKGGKKSGWKVLKARTFKKKTRVGKKKLRAIVKFKKGAKKTTKKKKAAKGKARPVDEPVAQPEIEEETASLNGESDSSDSEFETNDLTSDNTSSLPFERSTPALSAPAAPTPEAKISYDKAWAEFKSAIYSLLRTTDPDTIPEKILDTLDMKDVTRRLWKRCRYLLVKLLDGKSSYYRRIMLRPEAADSTEWRGLLKSLEEGKVCPRENLTFGALLNLKLLRATDNEALTGFAPRWEQAVWKLTNAICDLWDYDPVLSKTGLELTRANTL